MRVLGLLAKVKALVSHDVFFGGVISAAFTQPYWVPKLEAISAWSGLLVQPLTASGLVLLIVHRIQVIRKGRKSDDE
jgi:hypothetical protein